MTEEKGLETPRTEAGQALLEDFFGEGMILEPLEAILAIEREAAAAPPEPHGCGDPWHRMHSDPAGCPSCHGAAAPPEPPRPDLWETCGGTKCDCHYAICPDCGCTTPEDENGIARTWVATPEGLSLDVLTAERLADAIHYDYSVLCRDHPLSECPYQQSTRNPVNFMDRAERILARLSPSSGESGSPAHNEGSCALCTGWHDAEEAAFMNRPGESGSPTPIDEDRLFEALSFLGEDDILADGSLWKVKEIALNAAAEYNRVGSGSPGEEEGSDR